MLYAWVESTLKVVRIYQQVGFRPWNSCQVLRRCFRAYLLLQMQVLGQWNLLLSTMKLVDEDGDLEQASKPWTLVRTGHTIGNPKLIFAKMVQLPSGMRHVAVMTMQQKERRVEELVLGEPTLKTSDAKELKEVMRVVYILYA